MNKKREENHHPHKKKKKEKHRNRKISKSDKTITSSQMKGYYSAITSMSFH